MKFTKEILLCYSRNGKSQWICCGRKKFFMDEFQKFSQQSMPDIHYGINNEDLVQIFHNIWQLCPIRNEENLTVKIINLQQLLALEVLFTGNLKAASCIADIFIGRDEKSVIIDDFKSYIKEKISIYILDIEKKF